MKDRNILISDNEIIFRHLKLYIPKFKTDLIKDHRNLVHIRKINTLIVDCINQEDSFVNFLKNIYIKSKINLSSIYIPDCINLRKPFIFLDLLDMLKSKTNSRKFLYCYINDSFLYDEISSCFLIKNSVVKLTEKENSAFAFILKSDLYCSSKKSILRSVWNYNEDAESSTVENHMYKLRTKLPQNFLDIQGDIYKLNVNTIE